MYVLKRGRLGKSTKLNDPADLILVFIKKFDQTFQLGDIQTQTILCHKIVMESVLYIFFSIVVKENIVPFLFDCKV